MGRRGWLFEGGFFGGGGRGNSGGRLRRCGSGGGGSGDGSAAFGIGFCDRALGFGLAASGVVVGLFGFTVFVDAALALPEQVKNLSQIDVAPAFGPFFRGFRNGLQSFAKGVGGGLIILLVEERFAHAEICQRPAGLNREGALILGDGIVEAALFGEVLATRNSGSSTQPIHALEEDVL